MIFWVLGNKKAINSGVSKYSLELISEIKKKKSVRVLFVPGFFDGKLYYFGKYLYLPLYIIFLSIFFKRSSLIVPDESFSFYGLFGFLFSKKYIIVHDVRDVKGKNIREKIKGILIYINFYFLSFFDSVICVSNYTKKSVEKRFGNSNTHLCYNIIKPRKHVFKNKSKYNDIFSNGMKNIIYIGSHESRKNTLLLLEAFMSLNLKDVNLLTAGRFIDKKIYNEFKVKSSQSENVFCLGEVSDAELSYLLSSSDLYICISSFEGFGRTPVEAQYLGIPVMSTYNTGLSDALSKGSFYHIKEPLSLDNLKKDILTMLSKKNEDIGLIVDRGYLNADRFSADALSRHFESIINEKNNDNYI
ncbi:glycosyltransferase [Pectobacterium versatile]|uniref:glycosyltransferase n=1 Tax=Pectobacterium versatile TaxID=2488639 RepID=UPI00386ADDEE